MIFLTLWKKDKTLFFGLFMYVVSMIGLMVWLYTNDGPIKDVVVDTSPSQLIHQENPVDAFEDLCIVTPLEPGHHDFNDGMVIVLTSNHLCAMAFIGTFDLELMQQDLEVILGKVYNITKKKEYIWMNDSGIYVMNYNQHYLSISWWKEQKKVIE